MVSSKQSVHGPVTTFLIKLLEENDISYPQFRLGILPLQAPLLFVKVVFTPSFQISDENLRIRFHLLRLVFFVVRYTLSGVARRSLPIDVPLYGGFTVDHSQ